MIDLLKQGNVDAVHPERTPGLRLDRQRRRQAGPQHRRARQQGSSQLRLRRDRGLHRPEPGRHQELSLTCVQEAAKEVNGNPELAAKVAQEQLGLQARAAHQCLLPDLRHRRRHPGRDRQDLRPRGQVRNPDRQAQRRGRPGRIRVADMTTTSNTAVLARRTGQKPGQGGPPSPKISGLHGRNSSPSPRSWSCGRSSRSARSPTARLPAPVDGAAGLHRALGNQHLLGRDRHHPAVAGPPGWRSAR